MSSPAPPTLELEGLRVTLDRLVYQRSASEYFPGKSHCFAYFLSIHNDSEVEVTIKSRKWIIHEGGEVLVVEGDGVVGLSPDIPPGAKFSYDSSHRIAGPSADVEGSYFGVDSLNRRVFVRIPRFRLLVPPEGFSR